MSTLNRRAEWLLRGVRASLSIPGLILAGTFIGFASLAKGAGLTADQALLMTVMIFAMPTHLVLLGAITSGVTLPAAAFVVTLTSVRLAPMVVAILPEMRTPATPRWVLYFLSHFVVVTSWVLGMERLRHVPAEMRTTYFAGLSMSLVVWNSCAVVAFYLIAENLPATLSAMLLMLTPVYFVTSLWGSARERASHLAMVLGLVLGPAFHVFLPEIDLLAAGLVGGGMAYGAHRLGRKRPA